MASQEVNPAASGVSLQPEAQKKSYVDYLIELEEYKYRYGVARRPLIIYRNLYLFIILLLASAITANIFFSAYIGGWCIFVIILCILALIFLTVAFFTMDDTNEDSGPNGLCQLDKLASLKEEIEKTEMYLRVFEQHQATQLTSEEQIELYKDALREAIREYQTKANSNRWMYFILQMIIIAASLLVGGLTSGLSNVITIFGSHLLAPALSFGVSFLTAMITLFRPRERSYNLQQTADAIQYEIDCATRRIYGYKGLTTEQVYVKLAEEVEKLRYEQRKRQQQLEQASATKQPTD
ncbi:MAG TPA: SLATT domain-containing protein [Ktedonobacteraceae bacterium]|jgi:ABC-type multidrug transport system fused ATPase/permease subunit|nr:SLATT domain-containing protein [Ktedonobacteraceae bacterium]